MESTWLVQPTRPEPEQILLLCFPAAGGGAGAFRLWPAAMWPEVGLAFVRLPARESRIREAPSRDIGELIAPLVDAVVSLGPTPLAIFGHCSGALLAFEFARALRRANGRAPVLLAVAGRRPPDTQPITPISALPDAQFVAKVADLGGIPREVLASPDMIALATPALRADFALVESYRYRYEAPLTCPVLALVGSRDLLSLADVAGWARHTTMAFSSSLVAGDHFFVQQPPAALLAAMREQLERLLVA
jgi:medium-chain acyl-[acyl-carrier-protein] hydrolase